MIAEFVNMLDANFVLALLMFLIFFLFAMLAAVADLIARKIEERKTQRYYARFHQPIGRVTDYQVISNGFLADNSQLTANRQKAKAERKR